MNNPLVSIIIPTFNRAFLVGETLDSIVAQTYTNWECVLVDDGSTDNMDEVLNSYCKKDKRFIYFKRPSYKPKGGNACRNFGIEKATGDFIVLFDSDDLMTPNHIALKVTTILKENCDFVVTKTNFFNYDEGNIRLEKKYDFNSSDITAYNYITQKINWLTYDICIKAEIARSIYFNEELMSGQEYNYFSKLLLLTCNAVFIREKVTLRRFHKESIRGNLRSNELKTNQSYFKAHWHTYNDVFKQSSSQINKYLIKKCINLACGNSKNYKGYKFKLFKSIVQVYGLKGFYHIFRILKHNLN